MKIEARIIKNILVMTAQPLVLNVISLFAIAYIARKLGLVDFGTFNLAILFSTFFYPFGLLGLNTVAVRDISAIRNDADLAKDYVGKNLVLRFWVAGFAFLLVIVSANLMNYPGRVTTAILIAGLVLTIQLLLESVCDVFSAFEKMEYTALTSMIAGLSLTVLSVAVLYFGYGLLEVIGVYAVGQLLGFVVSIALLPKVISAVRLSADFSFWRDKIRRGLPFISMSLMWAAVTRLDTVFLSKATSAEGVGYYTAAMLLVTKINIIPEALSAALFPAISNLHAQRDALKVEILYRRFTTLSLAVALPICIETAFFSRDILDLLFGGQYSSASGVLAWSIWALLLRCLMFIQFPILAATHNEVQAMKAYVVALACSLALNGVLTLWYEVPGALGSFLATQMILLLGFSYYVSRSLSIRLDWHKIITLLLLNVLLLLSLFGMRSIYFLITVGVSIPGYVLACFTTGIIPLSDVQFFMRFPRRSRDALQ